jgi:hypothetical protein
MLGIRTLLGLEPKGDVLTSAANPVVPDWMGTLSVSGIPGRWGRASVVVKGDDTRALTTKQIYEQFLSRREEMEHEQLAA